MTDSELDDKFIRLTGPVLDAGRPIRCLRRSATQSPRQRTYGHWPPRPRQGCPHE